MPAHMKTSGPYCPCEICTIFSDDFATDRTGTDYTILSGTPTVSSGVLTTTSTGFLIVENTAGTTGHGRVVVTGKSSASGGDFSVYGSYVDANNNVRAELTINGASSTLKLWQLASGSPTQIGTTYTFTGATNTNYTVEICWNGSSASAMLNNINGSVISGAFTGTGNKAALGANPNGGTVTFDNLSFGKHHDDNASCTLCRIVSLNCVASSSTCVGEIAPKYLRVVVNFTVGAGTCNSLCTPLIGSFIIPLLEIIDQSGGSGSISQCLLTCCDAQLGPYQCWWHWDGQASTANSCGGFVPNPSTTQIRIGLLEFDDGLRLEGELYFLNDPVGSNITVLKSAVIALSSINCLEDIDGIVLTEVCTSRPGGNTTCQLSGVTFTVYVA